jgi:hypothetical protein
LLPKGENEKGEEKGVQFFLVTLDACVHTCHMHHGYHVDTLHPTDPKI